MVHNGRRRSFRALDGSNSISFEDGLIEIEYFSSLLGGYASYGIAASLYSQQGTVIPCTSFFEDQNPLEYLRQCGVGADSLASEAGEGACVFVFTFVDENGVESKTPLIIENPLAETLFHRTNSFLGRFNIESRSRLDVYEIPDRRLCEVLGIEYQANSNFALTIGRGDVEKLAEDIMLWNEFTATFEPIFSNFPDNIRHLLLNTDSEQVGKSMMMKTITMLYSLDGEVLKQLDDYLGRLNDELRQYSSTGSGVLSKGRLYAGPQLTNVPSSSLDYEIKELEKTVYYKENINMQNVLGGVSESFLIQSLLMLEQVDIDFDSPDELLLALFVKAQSQLLGTVGYQEDGVLHLKPRTDEDYSKKRAIEILLKLKPDLDLGQGAGQGQGLSPGLSPGPTLAD